MINSKTFTNHDPSDHELQEMFLFAMAVAGKPSKVTEEKINDLLWDIKADQADTAKYIDDDDFQKPQHFGPLEYLIWLDHEHFIALIRKHKLGKYSVWSQAWAWFRGLIMPSIPDLLRTAEIEDLEKIPGVRFKTSRFFVLHSRRDAECIPLDTHILHFLRDRGVSGVPSVTPGSKLIYHDLEQKAVQALKSLPFDSLARADLETWKAYSGGHQGVIKFFSQTP